MKTLDKLITSNIDVNVINDTIRRALAAAGLNTSSGPLRSVNNTLREALARGGLARPATAAPQAAEDVIDVQATVVGGGNGPAPGRFTTHRHTGAAGSRAFKLYVPAGAAPQRLPLVVMLHGCTQSADDFAAGTQMNRLADAHGLLVVYPEQAADANASRCWNWFRPQDQTREAGEPSLLAGIVRQVAAGHAVDERRVFVAGLSAGAAMAVVLGQTYPEVFAAVGVHSGLPYASAHDIPTALAAMKGGRSGLPGQQRKAPGRSAQPVPMIVFHGDRDHTVQHSNGAAIVQQALSAFEAAALQAPLQSRTDAGVAAGGRAYSRQRWADAAGQVQIESWTVNGAGHAWSGGDARGSYTDSKGPDASAEMLRFFLGLPLALPLTLP